MLKPKRLRFLLLVAVFALVAAACGDDAEETTTTAAATTTEPAAAGQPFEVMAKWTPDSGEGENFQMVIDAFAADTGSNVTFSGVGDELPTILSTRVQGGDPPDVAILPQPGLLNDLVSLGALVSIEAAAGDLVDANYAPAWRELGSVDGTLYGVWYKVSNKGTVFYKTAAYDELGLSPPATFDDWVAQSQTFVDNGITPISVGGADGWTLSDWFENAYVRSAGPEKYDQLTNHEIPWTDPSVKEALGIMGQILSEDFMLGGSEGALQFGFTDSVVNVFGDDGEAVDVYEGSFVEDRIINDTNAAVGDYAFFEFPSIGGSPSSVIFSGDVAVLLTDNPSAAEFIRYLATAPAAEIWAAQGGYESPNNKVDTSVYPTDIAQLSAQMLAGAEVGRFDLSDLVPSALGATAGAGIWGGLQNWLANPADVDAILAQIEAEAEAAFG